MDWNGSLDLGSFFAKVARNNGNSGMGSKPTSSCQKFSIYQFETVTVVAVGVFFLG